MTTPETSAASPPAISSSEFANPPQLQEQSVIAPAGVQDRISGLDTVRGFALLGILLMNINSMGLPDAAYDFPLAAGGHTGWNLFTWAAVGFFADGKMRAIFSLAFGASVYLLVERLSRRGLSAEAADIHYRRMVWLLLFGMIHAYLIWNGDILFIYAMIGLVLYPLRKLSPRALLIGAGFLLLILSAYNVRWYLNIASLHREYDQVVAEENAGKKLTQEQEDKKKEWHDAISQYYPTAEELKKEADARLAGYVSSITYRARLVYSEHSHPLYDPLIWYDPLIMMMIGMALMKLGVFTGSYSTKFYLGMAALSFAVGVPANALCAWWPIHNQFSATSWYSTGPSYQIGRFMALGYVAVILLVVKHGVMKAVTRTLADVGRMAFSNYIMTSLICTTIFEGYGFGLFGKLQRYQLYGIVLAVWVVILVVSPIWLRHFRFGPLEWLWRSLTYWKKQPFRIAESI